MFWWTKCDLFLVTFLDVLRVHSIIKGWMDFARVWNIWWLREFGSKIGGGVGKWLQQEKEEGLSRFCSFLDNCCKYIFGSLHPSWLFTESKPGKEFWRQFFFQLGVVPFPKMKKKKIRIVRNFRASILNLSLTDEKLLFRNVKWQSQCG